MWDLTEGRKTNCAIWVIYLFIYLFGLQVEGRGKKMKKRGEEEGGRRIEGFFFFFLGCRGKKMKMGEKRGGG